MLGHSERYPVREMLDRALEIFVGEGLEAATKVTHKMMMMVLVARSHGLVAHHAATDLEPLDHADLLELLEDAVDARARHPSSPAGQDVFDLERRQRARLLTHESKNLAARPTAPVAGVGQALERLLDPLVCTGGSCHRGRF